MAKLPELPELPPWLQKAVLVGLCSLLILASLFRPSRWTTVETYADHSQKISTKETKRTYGSRGEGSGGMHPPGHDDQRVWDGDEYVRKSSITPCTCPQNCKKHDPTAYSSNLKPELPALQMQDAYVATHLAGSSSANGHPFLTEQLESSADLHTPSPKLT